ncbi:MAG: S9 family peptidase [Flavobacteriaceae bacterium]|nr:S9 family peptidase [Flavobacteriaceae bacterium]
MRIFKLLFLFIFLVVSNIQAQNKEITLEEIWNGTFRTERIDALNSMNNGQHYSVLNNDRINENVSIDIYDYRTSQKVKTYFSTKDFTEIDKFSSYTFSEDETKVILGTEIRPIYRRSRIGKYYVFNSLVNSLQLISEEEIQEPTFSPDGNKIAYVLNNNIYVKDLVMNSTKQVTYDGVKNKIINGITDWVYEEEFKFVRAFDWNSGSDRIAYIKFDETNVAEFSMDIYGKELYPEQQVFKYPKAGETNSKVTLYIYDILTNESEKVYFEEEYKDTYIPRIKWTKDSEILSAQYLNRHQNELDLWLINANGYESAVVLKEISDTYVGITDNLTFLEDNSFIWTSEKDGYNHIYYYNKYGKLINQVTKGKWDVTKLYGYDSKTKKIFYQSVEKGSINRDIYSIGINGLDKKRLTKSEGTHNASFSSDYGFFINRFSNSTNPPEYTLNDSGTGNVLKKIKDNKALSTKLSDYKLPKKEFSTIKVNGYDLNMWMIKPTNFNPGDQYPLLMYQYSGPGSQSVANTWNGANDYWHRMLAQQGYIIVCIDGRGTGYRGAEFKKKLTYLNMVKYETEDQIAAAKQLGSLSYIDAERIGIWGWSFGGHMSTNCILKGNDIFSMAIAVAPTTSWRFYDTIYTERYMRTPEENLNGYDDNSPFNYPELLKGNYLIIHGSADDNVHLQNTMRMVEALIQADKQFEWAIYPDKNHGIYGGNTRLHLYKKMTNFINKHLGNGSNKIYTNASTGYSENTSLKKSITNSKTLITGENVQKENNLIKENQEPKKILSKKEIRRNNIKKAKELRKQQSKDKTTN